MVITLWYLFYNFYIVWRTELCNWIKILQDLVYKDFIKQLAYKYKKLMLQPSCKLSFEKSAHCRKIAVIRLYITELMIVGILFSDTSILHHFSLVSYWVNFIVTKTLESDECVLTSSFHSHQMYTLYSKHYNIHVQGMKTLGY